MQEKHHLNPPVSRQPLRFLRKMKLSISKKLLIGIIITAAFAWLLIAWFFASIRTFDTHHNPDPSGLRQIAQSSLISAYDNRDVYMESKAADIWDLATLLARYADLNDASCWVSKVDPANPDPIDARSIRILLPRQAPNTPLLPNPDFRQVRPSVAVVLGPITHATPATTPLAWTRGLQSDGTWAAHSPYGTQGGFIVFKDASVRSFTDLKKDGGQLIRFDGKGNTSNILEALPPGSRISEYEPTPAEKKAWSKPSRTFDPFGQN